jgi:hypothetical protein
MIKVFSVRTRLEETTAGSNLLSAGSVTTESLASSKKTAARHIFSN